jgi:hypothetical protein
MDDIKNAILKKWVQGVWQVQEEALQILFESSNLFLEQEDDSSDIQLNS